MKCGKELAPGQEVPEIPALEMDEALRKSQSIVVGKMQHLKRYNGRGIENAERKDYELYYLKYAYEYYLRNMMDV